jgi:hypothetical protein
MAPPTTPPKAAKSRKAIRVIESSSKDNNALETKEGLTPAGATKCDIEVCGSSKDIVSYTNSYKLT